MAKRRPPTGIPAVQRLIPATQSPLQRLQEKRHKAAIGRARGKSTRVLPKVKFK